MYGEFLMLAERRLCVPYNGRYNPATGTSIKYRGIFVPMRWLNPSQCRHVETICDVCRVTWAYDWEIREFRSHGDLGYRLGCRCDECINVRSKFMPQSQRDRAWLDNARIKELIQGK